MPGPLQRRLPGLLPGALLAVLPFPALAQISPGPLASAHQELDSPLKCLSCHGKGEEGAMRARCLECHKEIAWLEERKLGLHGSEDRGNCARCHPDHAGRKFAMVRWEEGSAERFRHQRSGWLLEGKHATTPCRDCHKAPFVTSEVVRLARKKDRQESYLGLEGTCLPRHRGNDVHRGSLGQGKPVPVFKPVPHADCSACHQDPHGARLGPACSRCHAAVKCVSCHQDVHLGELGDDCVRCHTPRSFLDRARMARGHQVTRFPLVGVPPGGRLRSVPQDGGPGEPLLRRSLHRGRPRNADRGGRTMGVATSC